MACGVPVAAFPVTGPIDVVEDGVTGALDADLGKRGVSGRCSSTRSACRARALQSSWTACTREFEANLVDCRPGPLARLVPKRRALQRTA